MRSATIWFAIAIFAGLPSAAWAHALGIEAKLKDGRVHVEAYFDDDTPARNAKVVVADLEKNIAAEGLTDAEGRWSFTAPAPGRYLIVVDAGDGHRSEQGLTIPGNAASPAIVTDGPARNEFTRPRWIGLGIGLLVIFGGMIAIRVGRRFVR